VELLLVFESSSTAKSTQAVAAAVGVAAAALVLVAPAAAVTPPTSRACPPASVVDKALGQKGKAPVATRTQYSKTCTYPGSGAVPTRVTFQVDTASTFAAGEKAAQALGIVKLRGLGKAAWATRSGGSLFVFDGHETIKIVSPLTPTSKLEGLARKLL